MWKLSGLYVVFLWILYRFYLVSFLDWVLLRLVKQCLLDFWVDSTWILSGISLRVKCENKLIQFWSIITNQTWIVLSCNLQVLISQKLHIDAWDLFIKNWDILDFFSTLEPFYRLPNEIYNQRRLGRITKLKSWYWKHN